MAGNNVKDNTQNYSLYNRLQLEVERMNAQVDVPTSQNSIKVTKVVKPTNKKCSFHGFY